MKIINIISFPIANFLGLTFWLFLLGYRNFARGFDFTDATLNYHFSLRILNGEIPFKDFHFSVMPLSFYIEAFFHKLFGPNYIINHYLGFITKLVQSFFIYKIFFSFYKKNTQSIILTIFLLSLVGTLEYPFHFSYIFLKPYR